MLLKRKEKINISKKEYIKNKIIKGINKKENRVYVFMALLVILTVVITCVYNFIVTRQKGLVINKNIMKENVTGKIGVYIDGQVNSPGYIVIPEDETLGYAIDKAHGITKDADIQNIDINKKLKDQEKIIIPKKKEINDDIQEEAEEKNEGKININTANKEELMQIDGIGEKTAERIIEYRENNKFTNIESLKEVKGIGDKKFEKIKDKIEV